MGTVLWPIVLSAFILSQPAGAASLRCSYWFAKLTGRELRNPYADVALGRGGRGMEIVYLGYPKSWGYRTVTGLARPDEVAVVDSRLYDSVYSARRPAWGEAPPSVPGRMAISGEPVDIPLHTYSYTSDELEAWSRFLKAPDYRAWSILRTLPLRTAASIGRELPHLMNHSGVELFKDPVLFRWLFEPYVRNAVRNGGRLHISLHAEDEAFLRRLSALPERERLAEVARLTKEYFDGRHKEDLGSLTRLELLAVAQDAELFAGSVFYRDYSHVPLAREEVPGLWVGGH